jgi:hypothetical protein
MVELSVEYVVVVVLVTFVGGALLGRALLDSRAFLRLATWYQRSTPAKALYVVPVVGPAMHEVFTDTAVRPDDDATFRQFWGIKPGDTVQVVVPTVAPENRPPVAFADGGGDPVVVGDAHLTSDRFVDGERYTVQVTPDDVSRIEDDGSERVVLYYADADGQSRSVTVWGTTPELYAHEFEPGRPYVLSAVRYQFSKGRFHDLVTTGDSELLEEGAAGGDGVRASDDGTVPTVDCPVDGCDFEGSPVSVGAHIQSQQHDPAHDWERVNATLGTATCPVQGCDREGSVVFLGGHVYGTDDPEHSFEALGYEDRSAFVNAVWLDQLGDASAHGEAGDLPPMVPCPADGCDYEHTPTNVADHVSRQFRDHDWEALSPDDEAALVSCPADDCGYRAPPRTVADHVGNTHGWTATPYPDADEFLHAHWDAVVADASAGGTSAAGATDDGGTGRAATDDRGTDGDGDTDAVEGGAADEPRDDTAEGASTGDPTGERREPADAGPEGGAQGGADPGEDVGGTHEDVVRELDRPGYRNVDAVIHVLLELLSLYPSADVQVLTDEEYTAVSPRRRGEHTVLIGQPTDDHVQQWVDNPHFGVEPEGPAFREVRTGERYAAAERDGRLLDYGLFVKRPNPNDRSRELVVVAGLTARSTFDAARAFLPQGGRPGEGDTNCSKVLHQLAEPPAERAANPHFATVFQVERVHGSAFVSKPSDFRRL